MQQLEQHDIELERTILAALFHYQDFLDEPWAAIPEEAFYLEGHRVILREMRLQHREAGGYDFVSLATAFRSRGDHTLFQRAFMPMITEWDAQRFPIGAFIQTHVRQLLELYVKREKARAILKYQSDILKADTNQHSAKLELDALLTAMDATLHHGDDRTDEELAEIIGGGARYLTGFQTVDRLTGGLARPGLNILAARPSVGKSALARTIIRHAAARGNRVLWYSKDQSESQILELEIARHLRISTEDVRALPHEDVITAIGQVRRDVWRSRVTLLDRPIPLDELVGLIDSSTPDLVVIDYLQILDTGHDDEYESITAASKALKTAAFRTRTPILALAQFNRTYKPGTPPSMSALRGSGQIEQDADQVWALDRDTTLSALQDQQAQFYVLKNKVGPTGMTSLHWHARYASYEAVAHRSHP